VLIPLLFLGRPDEAMAQGASIEQEVLPCACGQADPPFSREGNALAEKSFRQAIELDPTFAGGYRGLAFTQWQAAASGYQRLSLRSGSGRGSDFAGLSVRGDQANRDRQNVHAGQTGLNGFTSSIVWRYRQGIG
jgi:hypothetical protein